MSSEDRRRILLTVAVIGAGLVLAWGALGVLSSLRWLLEASAVAVFMALAAEPAIYRMERRGIGRGVGAGLMVIGVIGVAVGIGWVLLPAVGRALSFLVENADRVGAEVGGVAGKFGVDPETAAAGVETWIGEARTAVGDQGGGRVVAAAGVALLQVASALFLFYYLLAKGPEVRAGVLRLISGEKRRALAARAWDMAIEKTGGFIYGNLVLAGVCGGVTAATAWYLDLPAAWGLGAWALVGSFVPVLGGWLASALPVLVAFTADLASEGGGFRTTIVMVAVLLAFQAVDNYALRPRVLSKAVDVPPALAFLAVVGGASAAGVAGAVLAIPVAAILFAFAGEWMRGRPDLEAELVGEMATAEAGPKPSRKGRTATGRRRRRGSSVARGGEHREEGGGAAGKGVGAGEGEGEEREGAKSG